MPKKKAEFKVIVAGPPRTGKSTLVLQLRDERPISDAEVHIGTPGIGRTDIVEKKFNVNGCEVTLKVWDAIGQTESLSTLFYRESVGIILLFDCTDYGSLEELYKFEEKSEQSIRNFESVTYFLAANMSDSDNKDGETIESGREKAKNKEYMFFEVSAKTGEGVQEMFRKMAECLQQKYTENTITTYTNVNLGDSVSSQSKQKQGGCCK